MTETRDEGAAPPGTAAPGEETRPDAEVLFDAVITPHRSLTPRGFAALMAAIGGFGFAAGAVFVAMGAWPVFGFLGLDVALIYWAFRLNYRSARAQEHVVLTRESLVIRRFDHRGRGVEITMPSYWLRLEVAGDEEAREIRLTTHGESQTVGAWLSPAERVEFADALGEALRAMRAPPGLGSGA